MAITTAVCNSAKGQMLQGLHDFTVSTGDSFKIALFNAASNLSKTTTDYAVTQEAAVTGGGGGYTAGGAALVIATGSPVASGDSYCADFDDVVWTITGGTSPTLPADGCMIYNTTTGALTSQTDAIAVYDFGGTVTASGTGSTFTVTMPAPAAGTAVLELA